MDDYKKCFGKIKNVAENGNVQMSILKKTASMNDEKKREILRVEVDNEVKDLFTHNLKELCDRIIEDDDLVFCDFFSNNHDSDSISFINKEDMVSIGTLSPIISKIKSEDVVDYVREFDETTIDKLQSYAICITHFNDETKSEDTCIYFRKYGRGYKISKSKTFSIFNFKNGKFDKLEGDIFKCDNSIDVIYYESIAEDESETEEDDKKEIKLLFVRRVGEFEDIFSFHDLYMNEAKIIYDALSAHDNIIIEEGLFEDIKDKISYIKTLSYLNRNNFADNFDFDMVKQVYEKTTQNYVLNFEIKDDKLIIRDKYALKDFLYICERKIVRDLMDDETIYKTNNIRELPKR